MIQKNHIFISHQKRCQALDVTVVLGSRMFLSARAAVADGWVDHLVAADVKEAAF